MPEGPSKTAGIPLFEVTCTAMRGKPHMKIETEILDKFAQAIPL